MKKLFTLIVCLVCFLGAKAEQVVDYHIDYSTYNGFPFYVMGYVPEFDNGCMTDFGANYKYAEVKDDAEETSNVIVKTQSGSEYYRWTEGGGWHQYFIADGIPTEVDGRYTVKAMVRASEAVSINVNMNWGWADGQSLSKSVPIGTEWTEVEWEYTGIGGTSCNLVAQPGSNTATIEWKELTVYHNKGGQSPVNWVQDYMIDYSNNYGFPFYVMSYVPEWVDGVMTDYGAMYKYVKVDEAEETSDVIVTTGSGVEYYKIALESPSWHQYFIADGIPTEIDGSYTVKAMVRASKPCTINVDMKWGWGTGQNLPASVTIGTEWTEVVWDYSGIGGTSCFLMAQPGSMTATIEWKYVIVGHTPKAHQETEWIENLTNGNAETLWGDLANVAYNDLDNNFKICAWAKEREVNMNEFGGWDPFPASIEVDPTDEKNHVFVVHAQPATTEGDASAWDNQFWIQSPRAWKTGEQVKIHFRYRASQAAKTNSQMAYYPDSYKVWHAIGDINFTEDWQTFDGIMTIQDDMDGAMAIAFNLNTEVKDAVDFYFDDLSWQSMVLDEGYFVAGANPDTGLDYDLDNAIQFEDEDGILVATVGEKGNVASYVDQIMISTVRGNDAAFKSNTLKPNGSIYNDPDEWLDYSASSLAKLNLPAAGIWKIYLDLEYRCMAFEMIEGAEKPKIDIYPNTTNIVVNALERDWLSADADGNAREEEIGTGQTWDNQFFIVANRTLKAGENTILKFKYKASKEAKTWTQCDARPSEYLTWRAIGNVYFTTEWQELETVFTVPDEADGMQTLCWNMAEIKEACYYEITDVVWKLADDTESLIDQTGANNFYVKEGAGTDPRVFDESLVENAYLAISNRTVTKGQGDYLNISLQTQKDIVALQFDLELPYGFDFTRIDLNMSNDKTHEVSYNQQEDGSWRFVIASTKNKVFTDIEQLMNIVLYVNDYVDLGSYLVTLKNVEMTTQDYETLKPSDKSFWITVVDPVKLGDVNNDTYVNVTDVVLIIDQILGKYPANFYERAADVNGDGLINVTDVVLVIDAILGKVTLNRAPVADAEIGSLALSSFNGFNSTVGVSLTNPTAYTAFQMDVTLPMGVSLEKAELSDRATKSHHVSVSQTGEGRYRIVGVSLQNDVLNGNIGNLLNLTLKGNNQASGTVAIDNIVFVTPNGTQHNLAGIEAYGDATGITDVRMSDSNADTYDLQGRRVNTLKKGLYISNGKKTVMK